MASTPTRLMTFAEFEQLPDSAQGRQELRHGEVWTVAPPKPKHLMAAHRLFDLVRAAVGEAGQAFIEFGFKPQADYEYRIADVAVVAKERWETIDPEGYFEGAPGLVIEILSPSNTVSEMIDKERLCLENGALQFWIVDLKRMLVKVSTPDGLTTTYTRGQEIPVPFGSNISVDRIFSE